MDHVTLQFGADGRMVMIEPSVKAGLTRRAFRRNDSGHLEYCTLDAWERDGSRARFYGWASKELPASMTCNEDQP